MASRATGSIALKAAAASLTLSSFCRSSAESLTVVGGSSHPFAFAFGASALRARPPATTSGASVTFASSALTMTTPPNESTAVAAAAVAAPPLLPQRPLRYLSGGEGGREFRPLDLTGLDATIAESEGRKEEAFALSRKINMCLARRRF
eukprot:CAMPEP_0113577952 /NCGR_PEP_ID=MMETSP0015_2-20120614/29181_1 /TAXON_ID=2838 /ORGANISM="Odontella" /LENGTH=148 /DNA_ID=CAMNT_0000481643 /DNA_START=51 /DNA_END=494 /DNA_ORIENTATION=- /assembly_acc=CAM_ASM_000160